MKHKNRGFTLIEVMVVIAILGILAALVVPQLVGKDDKARVEAVKSDLKAISGALEIYKLDNHTYPTTEQGLEALVKAGESGETYLRKLPKDPWGHEYIYSAPGASAPYDLLSYGLDGKEGGEGYAKDINLADL